VDHGDERVSVVVSSRSSLVAEEPLAELALLGAFRRGSDAEDERAAFRFADALERALCHASDAPLQEIASRLTVPNAALLTRARRLAREVESGKSVGRA
jgi:hypothetical protein